MKTILTAIKAKLNEVSELKYIDEDWGQLNYYGTDIPVQWPCALVQLSGGQFSNTGRDRRTTPQNRQEGVLTFEITVGKVKLTNSSNRAPINQQNSAFDIWELVEKVHQALHGWKPTENTGSLIRSSVSSMKREDGVQEKTIVYTCGIHDC